MVESHPDEAEAWDALLTALQGAGRVEEQARTLGLVPRSIRTAEMVAPHEGWLAQERGDWNAAAEAYRPLRADPYRFRDGYRLGLCAAAGRQAGRGGRGRAKSPRTGRRTQGTPATFRNATKQNCAAATPARNSCGRSPTCENAWAGPTRPGRGTLWCYLRTRAMTRAAARSND